MLYSIPETIQKFSNKASSKSAIIFALFLLSLLQPVSAQWQQTGWPEGGLTSCITKVGSEIWTGTTMGIYASSDEGANWNSLPHFEHSSVTDIKAWGDTVVVLYSSNIAPDWNPSRNSTTSFDGGVTWSTVGFLFEGYEYAITRDSTTRINNTLFVLNYKYCYRSDDFGGSWSLFSDHWNGNTSISAAGKYGFIIKDETTSASIADYYYYNALVDSSIFLMTAELNYFQYSTLIRDSTIYAPFQEGDSIKLKRTHDYGLTWETVFSDTMQQGNYGTFSVHDSKLYFRGNLALFESADDGDSWTEIAQWPDYPVWQQLIQTSIYFKELLLDDGSYLVTDKAGIRRYTSDYTSSILTNHGISAANIIVFAENNDRLFISTKTSALVSDDNGASWQDLPSQLTGFKYSLFSGDTIIILGTDINAHKICRSWDNGATWDFHIIPYAVVMFDPITIGLIGQTIVLSGNQNNYYSNDLGLTWSAALPFPYVNLGNGGNTTQGGSLLKSGNDIFGVSSDGYVFEWQQGINNWHFISKTPGSTTKLYTLGSYIVASGYYFFAYSPDNCHHWITPQNNGLPTGYNGNTLFPENLIDYQGVWIGTFGEAGVYLSSDRGDHWSTLSTPSAFIASGGLAIVDSVLYAGSANGSVWKRSNPATVVSGIVFRDHNNDGIQDSDDETVAGIPVISVLGNAFYFSDENGEYRLFSDLAGDTIRPQLFMPGMGSIPAYYLTDGQTQVTDFGITMPDNFHDLTLDVTNINVFRPGFETLIQLTAQNRGSDNQQAEIRLVPGPALTVETAIPAASAQSGDTLIWITDPIHFLESKSISVTIHTSENAIPGDSAIIDAMVLPVNLDAHPVDNIVHYSDMIVSSFDPNDKECIQGAYFSPASVAAGEELQFCIRFQNTGTYSAQTIMITDQLSDYLELSSFRVISASAPYAFEITNDGLLQAHFNDIFLPSMDHNEPLSHGFIKYGIKCKPGTAINSVINNNAEIYFDFNSPVITNTTHTTIKDPVVSEISEFNSGDVIIFPNPGNNQLFVDTRVPGEKPALLKLYDAKGSCIKTIAIHNELESIPIETLSQGIYFGVITNTDNRIIANFRWLKD